MANDPVVSNVGLPDGFCEEYPLPLIGGCGVTGSSGSPEIPPEPPTLPQVASATLLLDLEADTLVLADNDPVSLWADQSGNGHDFTATVGARPIKQTAGGYPVVRFNGSSQFLSGGNFADNLSSFTIFIVFQHGAITGHRVLIGKVFDAGSDNPGWAGLVVNSGGLYTYFDIYLTDVIYSEQIQAGYLTGSRQLQVFETVSVNEIHIYTDGALDDFLIPSQSGATTFSNSVEVHIGSDGGEGSGNPPYIGDISAILLYSPAPSSSDRVAITAWLAARYGIAI